MEHRIPSSRMRISELLSLSPQVTGLLIELHVDCVGCSMNKFCTLATLCHQYELDPDKITAMIQTRLRPKAEEGASSNALARN
jgi:hypothetical protein